MKAKPIKFYNPKLSNDILAITTEVDSLRMAYVQRAIGNYLTEKPEQISRQGRPKNIVPLDEFERELSGDKYPADGYELSRHAHEAFTQCLHRSIRPSGGYRYIVSLPGELWLSNAQDDVDSTAQNQEVSYLYAAAEGLAVNIYRTRLYIAERPKCANQTLPITTRVEPATNNDASAITDVTGRLDRAVTELWTSQAFRESSLVMSS